MYASTKIFATTALATLLMLSGCSQPGPAPSDSADTKKAAEAPPEPVTAKAALWPITQSARNWATDFVILKLVPKDMTGYKNDGGKAPFWEATLASPSKAEYRVYTYAIAAQPPDIYKGVVVGRGMPWSGPTRDVMAIKLGDFNVDSDVAYKTAIASEAAASFLKKNPDKKLTTFDLAAAYRFPNPVWYMMWGDKKLGYVAYVNAYDGKVLK